MRVIPYHFTQASHFTSWILLKFSPNVPYRVVWKTPNFFWKIPNGLENMPPFWCKSHTPFLLSRRVSLNFGHFWTPITFDIDKVESWKLLHRLSLRRRFWIWTQIWSRILPKRIICISKSNFFLKKNFFLRFWPPGIGSIPLKS